MNNAMRLIFYAIIGVLSLLILGAIYIGGDGNLTAAIGLYSMYTLGVIAIAATVYFSVSGLITNPKKGIRSLISFGLIALVFLIAWAISGDEITLAYEKVEVTEPSVSKLVGGSLYMMYTMIAVVIFATLYSEVSKLFK